MAKSARTKSAVKVKKVKRAATRGKVKPKPRSRIGSKPRSKSVSKSGSKPATKKQAARRPRAARPEGIADKVASAFHTVVDAIQETRALRNKMGPRGSEP